MLKEKDIIELLMKNLQELFISTDFIKIKDMKSEVKGVFPTRQTRSD
jgi:hypothetical protein